MKKVLIVIMIFLLSGCFDYKELNNLAIITKMAIDKNNDTYEINFSIENLNDKNIIYTGSGKSISEAIDNIKNSIPKKLYIGHLSTIVINENMAKKNMEQLIDYLLRLKEAPTKAYIIVTKNKAKDIIEEIEPFESNTGKNILSNINTKITYTDFIKSVIKKNTEPILPVVNKANGKLNSNKSIALFKKYKLIGFTGEEETKGINLINNNIDELIIRLNCSKKNLVVRLSNINTKIKDKTILIKANAQITESNCNKNIKLLIDNKIKKLVNNGIKVTEKYKINKGKLKKINIKIKVIE